MANNFSNYFPSNAEFEAKWTEQIEARNHIFNWLELDQTTIYRIKQIVPRKSTKYGECWEMQLIDIKENQIKVWGPRVLIQELKESRKSYQIPFIRSLGQEKRGEKSYNAYRLCYQDQDGGAPYPVFQSIETPAVTVRDINDNELVNAAMDII